MPRVGVRVSRPVFFICGPNDSAAPLSAASPISIGRVSKPQQFSGTSIHLTWNPRHFRNRHAAAQESAAATGVSHKLKFIAVECCHGHDYFDTPGFVRGHIPSLLLRREDAEPPHRARCQRPNFLKSKCSERAAGVGSTCCFEPCQQHVHVERLSEKKIWTVGLRLRQ
jgi:hypothetical protein